MVARIPVYSDENNLHHISIYMEDDDGTFKRTQLEPLRLLRDNIEGISISQGDIISSKFDKNERSWRSPTVSFHYGRPQSVYQFLREKLAQNRFYVFTKPNLSGRIIKFTLHELRLKPSTSQQILKLLKEKYTNAVEIWSTEQYQLNIRRKKAAGVGVNARRHRLLEKKKRAIEKLKQNHQSASSPQQRKQIFVRYNEKSLESESPIWTAHNDGVSASVVKPKTSNKKDRSRDKESKLFDRLRFLLD